MAKPSAVSRSSIAAYRFEFPAGITVVGPFAREGSRMRPKTDGGNFAATANGLADSQQELASRQSESIQLRQWQRGVSERTAVREDVRAGSVHGFAKEKPAKAGQGPWRARVEWALGPSLVNLSEGKAPPVAARCLRTYCRAGGRSRRLGPRVRQRKTAKAGQGPWRARVEWALGPSLANLSEGKRSSSTFREVFGLHPG